MKKPANTSRAYTSFISLRDKALEKLLVTAQRKVNDELRAAFTRALEMILYRYSHIPKAQVNTNSAKYMVEVIRAKVNEEFHKSAGVIEGIYKDLIRQSYLLSAVGEAQAIIQATGEKAAVHINDHDLRVASEKTAQGEDILDRILLAFSKISSSLIHAVELSRIRGEGGDELKKRLIRALPATRPVKAPRKALKPIIKEAEGKRKGVSLDVSAFIPEDEWQDMVDAYIEEFVPGNRGPEDVLDVDVGEAELEEWYRWEIENQMSHDFVNSVRSGQNEAAKQQGIVDFSIIAVIDQKTCEDCCGKYGCVDFDGKTTAEVEEMTDGEQSAPPFHFNCRCTMAPMLDNMPELEQSNEEEFQQWLKT